MQSIRTRYFISLYKAVLAGKQIDEAPLAFAERIDAAVQHYLKDECQLPQPPLHEV